MSEPYTPTADDLLAGIAFQAQRIVNAASQTAAGAPMPDPRSLQAALDHMNRLNAQLSVLVKGEASMSAASGMSVEFH